MWYMFVTLDVSRLSGWLNALAFYRAERRAYDAGGIRARRREGVGRRLCMQHTDEDSAGHRGRGTRGAHPKHIAHGCDTGRVETQRLVEHQRALPSGREDTQSGQHAGWDTGGGMGRRRRMQRAGEDPTRDRAQGTRGAHMEHVAHLCDFGRVEAQRLVERRRALRYRGGGRG